MPRYYYKKISVAAFEPIEFDLRDPAALRMAVECLRSRTPYTKGSGLVLRTRTTAGPYKLNACVLISPHEIAGKTPSELWEHIDARVDEQRDSLANSYEHAVLPDR